MDKLKLKAKKEKNKLKDTDIVIPLMKSISDDCGFEYNVSYFLRQHMSKINPRKWIENANEFIRLLDKKVYVDASDPRYAYTYDGIDIIVQRVIEELGKLDPFFKCAKLRQTGSIFSNVKVGLPHEADYTLELPRHRKLKNGANFVGTLFKYMIRDMVKDDASELTKELDHWVLHGVKEHRFICGVCLVLECKLGNGSSDSLGVTVDIVPVYLVTKTDETFNEPACAFLPHSLQEYAKSGRLYQLMDTDECDTGLIENTIVKELPNDQKQTFRVVKFLLQNKVNLPRVSLNDFETIDKELRMQLFGCKPIISSYHLRILFLHLLLHVQGTEAEQHLKGGVLAACLFDMIIHCINTVFKYGE